jgi:hypothetical protein
MLLAIGRSDLFMIDRRELFLATIIGMPQPLSAATKPVNGRTYSREATALTGSVMDLLRRSERSINGSFGEPFSDLIRTKWIFLAEDSLKTRLR